MTSMCLAPSSWASVCTTTPSAWRDLSLEVRTCFGYQLFLLCSALSCLFLSFAAGPVRLLLFVGGFFVVFFLDGVVFLQLSSQNIKETFDFPSTIVLIFSSSLKNSCLHLWCWFAT